MKYSPAFRNPTAGSALITVIFLCFMMGLLTTSMLRYSGNERRGNERNRLILRAKNAAENTTVYAAEQLTSKLLGMGTTPVMRFPWTGTSNLRVYLPPDQVLDTGFTAHGKVEMRCGIMAASGLVLDNDPSSPNYNLQVNIAKVPIIAKATANHSALGDVVTYVQQDMAIALTPLFQFGMFYNMDLELYPSADFTLSGPVHTNGRLMAHPDGSSQTTIQFTDRVSAVGGVYADAAMKTVTRIGSGEETDVKKPYGQITFVHAGTKVPTSLKNNTAMNTGAWRDHKFTTTSETASTITNFRTFATDKYAGNLRSSAHGVTALELPGIGGYKEQNQADPHNVDERSNGRQIIEPPDALLWVWNTTSNTGAWTPNEDTKEQRKTKISWRAGLYIISNPTASIRTCSLPDTTAETPSIASLLPYTYRAFLNFTNQETHTHVVREVILPGQPSYGYNDNGTPGTTAVATADDYMYRNYMPNRYTANNSVMGNQVLRIPQATYGTASGYLLNNIHLAGASSLSIDSGSGPIAAGETVTIKGYKYLVATGLEGGTIKLATGLRFDVPDNEPVTVDVASSNPGTGRDYQINNAAGYAINATTIAVDTGTGTIPINNFITIGTRKYRVTATTGSPSVSSITITPGLGAAVANDTPVTIDSMSGTVGNVSTNYQVDVNATGFVAGVSKIKLDTGTGTLLPGNVISFAGNSGKYVVASALAKEGSDSYVIITPGIVGTTVTNDTVVTLETTLGTHVLGTGAGYLTSAAVTAGNNPITLNTGNGTIPPGSTIVIAHKPYIVTSSTGSPVTSVTVAGPVPAIGAGELVMLDPFRFSGYSRSGGTGAIFPEDSAAIINAADAYFFDMRRANSNRGVIGTNLNPGDQAKYDRYNVPFSARPIAKIDFDMLRFKMMYDRVIGVATVSTLYDPRAPNTAGATWLNSIYNADNNTVRADFGLGMGATFSTFPAAGSVATLAAQDPSRLYYAPNDPLAANIFTNPMGYAVPKDDLFKSTEPKDGAWYDGIAIYLHSLDAEVRAQTSGVPRRIDSGVRLLNGRGPVASTGTTGKQGFTFVTNDAVYIIGHFNANGKVNSATGSSGNGGFSARWPDSDEEKLCAVMGDAFTALSQPYWTDATSGQTKGWNDAYSALPAKATTAGWRKNTSDTQAIVGGQDGVFTATTYKPGLLPTNNTPGTIGADSNVKLGAYTTEMSTALLVGIVPTNHSPGYVAGTPATWALTDGFVPTWTHNATGDPLQKGNRVNAGGANNFPRLLENWKPIATPTVPTQTLYIRGSMVAMYECRVAMEPFTNSRCYEAPNRTWGLHQNFSTVDHDLPLEPILLGSTRLGFRELTPAEYEAMKKKIEDLPPPSS